MMTSNRNKRDANPLKNYSRCTWTDSLVERLLGFSIGRDGKHVLRLIRHKGKKTQTNGHHYRSELWVKICWYRELLSLHIEASLPVIL